MLHSLVLLKLLNVVTVSTSAAVLVLCVARALWASLGIQITNTNFSPGVEEMLSKALPGVFACRLCNTYTCSLFTGLQEDSRKQGEDTQLRQQELINLRQQIEDQAAELRTVTAEAASQQASSNYLIKHLQSQLQASQAEKDACKQATQKPLQDTGWTIQQATASVARVLKVMSESQAR